MSILIKGMEMPKDGAFVEVLIWSDGHVTQTGDSYFAEDGRAYYQPCDWKYFSAVPVPVKHGEWVGVMTEEWCTFDECKCSVCGVVEYLIKDGRSFPTARTAE